MDVYMVCRLIYHHIYCAVTTLKSLTQNHTSACEAGQFLGNNGCENCAADHYGAGGWLTSCTQCPSGKGVEAGKGTQESDCTWSKCINKPNGFC